MTLTECNKRVKFAQKRARKRGVEATLTAEEWFEIVASFGGKCAYCLVAMGDTLDHVIPLSAGGGTTKDNCVPACWECNNRKGGQTHGQPNGSRGWVPSIASRFWPSIAESIYAKEYA